MAVYLLHFEPAYKHARHYLGYSPELPSRIHAHLNGKGARLTQVAVEAGSRLILVRVWEDGDRFTERRLKAWHNGKAHCPICRGEPVQLPLLAEMPAYALPPFVEEHHSRGWDAEPPTPCPICAMPLEFPF